MTLNEYKGIRQYYGAMKSLFKHGRSEPEPQEPEMLVAYENKPGFSKWTAIWLALVFGLCLIASCSKTAFAYTNEQAVLVVIGEAEGEPQEGKEAVACAMHYRGTLNGVYGLHAPRVLQHKYSSHIYKMAKRAVEMANDQEYCEALVHGADHWEGTAFKTPVWARGMRLTAVIGHQRFYKERG